MAIRPVNYYLAEKGKPSFYILIYNKSKPPRPIQTNQILKADTWEEAKQFAACFCNATRLQYVEISALSPLQDETSAWETNKWEFWYDEDHKGVVYRRSDMSAPTLQTLSEKPSCPVVEP